MVAFPRRHAGHRAGRDRGALGRDRRERAGGARAVPVAGDDRRRAPDGSPGGRPAARRRRAARRPQRELPLDQALLGRGRVALARDRTPVRPGDRTREAVRGRAPSSRTCDQAARARVGAGGGGVAAGGRGRGRAHRRRDPREPQGLDRRDHRRRARHRDDRGRGASAAPPGSAARTHRARGTLAVGRRGGAEGGRLAGVARGARPALSGPRGRLGRHGRSRVGLRLARGLGQRRGCPVRELRRASGVRRTATSRARGDRGPGGAGARALVAAAGARGGAASRGAGRSGEGRVRRDESGSRRRGGRGRGVDRGGRGARRGRRRDRLRHARPEPARGDLHVRRAGRGAADGVPRSTGPDGRRVPIRRSGARPRVRRSRRRARTRAARPGRCARWPPPRSPQGPRASASSVWGSTASGRSRRTSSGSSRRSRRRPARRSSSRASSRPSSARSAARRVCRR